MKRFVAISNSYSKWPRAHSIRLKLRSGVNQCAHALFLWLTITCSGCIGVVYDGTATETIENPIPLRDPLHATVDFERWACQPGPGHARRTRNDFLLSWGEPISKAVSAGKETWTYAESGRWCGVWIAFGLAIPLMLPVCETYDEITFENDLAISAISGRFVHSGFGLIVAPYPGFGFFRAGIYTDNQPVIRIFPNEQLDINCSWRSPRQAATTSEAAQRSLPDRVNCFSGGKRQWVERSLCD